MRSFTYLSGTNTTLHHVIQATMNSIPKNNLKEQMLKLGYNPDVVKIEPPVLDNSKVVKQERKLVQDQSSSFKPPVIADIDEWSDFEDD